MAATVNADPSSFVADGDDVSRETRVTKRATSEEPALDDIVMGAEQAKGAEREALDEEAAYPFQLGAYERADVHLRSEIATRWFNRGLKWMFGFHHEEAIRCFERALQCEPDFGMAWWGISHCHSPNYNVHQKNGYFQISATPEGFPSQKVAFEAINKALEHKAEVNDAGQALIEAQRTRCLWPANDFGHLLVRPFCDALRLIHVSYPEDEDVACLFVEALMQLSPWQLFDAATGEPAPQVPEIIEVLEGALAKAPRHPGLCHLAIHLWEMSPTPEKAMPQAEVLRSGLVPDAGHLLHMPSHLDVQLGKYMDAVRANESAMLANEKYMQYADKRGEDYGMYMGYISHDLHMLCYSAMLGGMGAKAMGAALRLMQYVQNCVADHPQRAIDLDLYHATIFHVQIRFGKWREILEQPFFEDTECFCASNAVLHYARGLAFSALGQPEKAREDQAKFEAAREVETVYRRILHNNNAAELFKVSSPMLEGEILYREGKYEEAFAHLREAVRLEDMLAYDEPWGQMQPIRHALGALLLEQGHFDEAEAVLRRDLERYPANPWALVGLRDCLARRAADSAAAAADLTDVQAQLDAALTISDCQIVQSCACAGVRHLQSNV